MASGDSYMECQDDGNWKGNAPTCKSMWSWFKLFFIMYIGLDGTKMSH